MKNNFKYNRIAADLKEVLTKTINDEIDGCEYVSITEVIVTKDLVDAIVYISLLDLEQEEHILKQLKENEHILKDSIAHNLKIRRIPNLIFKYDDSLDNYNKIDSLIEQVNN